MPGPDRIHALLEAAATGQIAGQLAPPAALHQVQQARIAGPDLPELAAAAAALMADAEALAAQLRAQPATSAAVRRKWASAARDANEAAGWARLAALHLADLIAAEPGA
jgi:hypothetical protein